MQTQPQHGVSPKCPHESWSRVKTAFLSLKQNVELSNSAIWIILQYI